jgi:hypothetical protein
MKRPRRVKWAAWGRWACTLVAGLLAVLAVFSAFWGISYSSVSADGNVMVFVCVEAGLVNAGRDADFGFPEYAGQSGVRLHPTREWHWGVQDEPHTASDWRTGFEWTWNPTQRFAGVSLVYPTALASVAAAVLWYRHRRAFGPGRCRKCGYDRRGLSADAKCPECGTVPGRAA